MRDSKQCGIDILPIFLLRSGSTSLAKTPPKNFTEMSRKLFNNSTETMELQDLVGGASTTTTSSSQQVTPLQHLGSMVYLKYTRLTALCNP